MQEVELVRKKVCSDTGEAEVKVAKAGVEVVGAGKDVAEVIEVVVVASDSRDRSPIGQAVCFPDQISSVFGPERD